MRNKVVLLNLSGYGISYSNKNNPINYAYKPNLDYLFSNFPYANLISYGKEIGLNPFQMGNNRYNHLAISYNQKPYILSSYISKLIEDNSFYVNKVLADSFKKISDNFSKMHVICLLTSKNNLCNFNHLVSLIKMAKYYSLSKEQLLFDVILDDDVSLNSATAVYNSFTEILKSENFGKINTIIGRKYALDRNNNLKYSLRYYNLLVNLSGNQIDYFDDYILSQMNYLKDKNKRISLSNLYPAYFNNSSSSLKDNDIVLSTIFDGEYVSQILTLLSNPSSIKSEEFDYSELKSYKVIKFDTLEDNSKATFCFDKKEYSANLTQILHQNNLTQLRISDDFYYDYLNYYFDGMTNLDYQDVKRIKVEVCKNKNNTIVENLYKTDCKIKDRLIEELNEFKYDFSMVSFSSLDLLGHSNQGELIVQAVENLDKIVGEIYSYCLENNLILIVCSDHSIAEKNTKIGKNEHTISKVPFCLASKCYKIDKGGAITDIASYIYKIFQIKSDCTKKGESK